MVLLFSHLCDIADFVLEIIVAHLKRKFLFRDKEKSEHKGRGGRGRWGVLKINLIFGLQNIEDNLWQEQVNIK